MNSFLIVRLGSLGDVIHGIPVAAALRERFPDSRIDWMVDPRYVELLECTTCVDRAVPVNPRALYGSGATGLLRTLRELRQVRYDAAIDLQGLVKSAILSRLAGARQTVGFPRGHLREPLAELLYTGSPDPGESPHVIHKNLALLRAVGIERALVRFPIRIPPSPTADTLADRIGAHVLINPGAAWPNKRWPPDRHGAVAKQVFEELGLRTLVLWGPGEESIAQAVAAAAGGAAELSPPTRITELLALASRAKLMISGDTGPLHIAAAVGTPIVALFGPTFAERNGPWAEADITLSRSSQCVCHYERRCRRTTACIEDITVGEVVRAVRARLERHG